LPITAPSFLLPSRSFFQEADPYFLGIMSRTTYRPFHVGFRLARSCPYLPFQFLAQFRFSPHSRITFMRIAPPEIFVRPFFLLIVEPELFPSLLLHPARTSPFVFKATPQVRTRSDKASTEAAKGGLIQQPPPQNDDLSTCS